MIKSYLTNGMHNIKLVFYSLLLRIHNYSASFGEHLLRDFRYVVGDAQEDSSFAWMPLK